MCSKEIEFVFDLGVHCSVMAVICHGLLLNGIWFHLVGKIGVGYGLITKLLKRHGFWEVI